MEILNILSIVIFGNHALNLNDRRISVCVVCHRERKFCRKNRPSIIIFYAMLVEK